MSLLYTREKGWVQEKRPESIGGRLPANRRTSLTIHYIVNKSGYVTYFSTNAPSPFDPAWKTARNSGNFQVNRSARTDDGLKNSANGLVDMMGATNQRDYAGVVKGYLLEHNNNEDANARANQINAAIGQEEARNRLYNQEEQKVIQIANNTQGMDYLAQREQVEKLNLPGRTKDNAIKDFKTFYITEKLRPWDTGLGALDQLGQFDGEYYLETNPELRAQWNEAVEKDDVDIVNRFKLDKNWALFNYTETGKASGKRGSRVEATEAANLYSEPRRTDDEIAFIRKKQLGVKDPIETRKNFLAIPKVATQWERAKNDPLSGDGQYWRGLADRQFLDVDDPDDFMLMFRLSNREKDKKVNTNADDIIGVSDLEEEVFRIEKEKVGEVSKQFGALARDTLKQTIGELEKAQKENARLDFYNTLPQVRELNTMASELANSIAGDYQMGGISPINKKELTAKFQNLFGTNNNVTYNWQKFFDDQIANKYKDGVTLEEQDGSLIKIEKEFAESYIKDFLKPRFDTSRSMDEFESYVGERQAEQNPFDLQDYRTATKDFANTEADKFIADARNLPDRMFNSEFYFNPVGRSGSELYRDQKIQVGDDWKTAKLTPDELIDKPLEDGGRGTWAQQAYKYGIDLNNKSEFAKMHYEVIGQGKGFDPSEDFINATKVQNKVADIGKALEDKELQAEFRKFETPDELADEILKKLPTGDAELKERLSELGYGDFEGDSTQLRELLVNDAAKDAGLQIRRKLKYLQDEGDLPTQQNLGYTYIERDEDIRPGLPDGRPVTAQTPLFEAFAKAGFKGAEDDFYENFMTGTSKADQELVYQLSKGKPLNFGRKLLDDVGAAARLLDTPEEQGAREAREAKPYKSYFDTYEGDDYKKYTKKKTGRGFLDEYKDLFDTSAFSFSSPF